MIKLIGITGLARSGKDTVANYITGKYDFNDYAFAKPMKDAVKIIFGWSDEHVNGDLKEIRDSLYGVSPRKAMQTLGTEWGRNLINKDLWLIRAQREIDNTSNMLVITDVRFNNEAQLIKDNGGAVINICRNNRPMIKAHVSESGIDENLIDFTIYNNGSLSDLYNEVEHILSIYKHEGEII